MVSGELCNVAAEPVAQVCAVRRRERIAGEDGIEAAGRLATSPLPLFRVKVQFESQGLLSPGMTQAVGTRRRIHARLQIRRTLAMIGITPLAIPAGA